MIAPSIVALISADDESTAVVKATREGFGLVSQARDMGIKPNGSVLMDANVVESHLEKWCLEREVHQYPGVMDAIEKVEEGGRVQQSPPIW